MAEPEDRHQECRATWVDEEVVVCESGPNILVTSRKPQDLPAFCDTFTKAFAGRGA